MRKRARVAVPPVSQEERQPQQQVSPESREQEPMQEIVVQNGPPPEENRPPPHESNVAQSKHPVNDNQAAISLADGQGDYRRAKHIDIRYHFIRDHLQQGTLEIAYYSFRTATSRLPHNNACLHGLRLD